jgi:hypothetical protein
MRFRLARANTELQRVDICDRITLAWPAPVPVHSILHTVTTCFADPCMNARSLKRHQLNHSVIGFGHKGHVYGLLLFAALSTKSAYAKKGLLSKPDSCLAVLPAVRVRMRNERALQLYASV